MMKGICSQIEKQHLRQLFVDDMDGYMYLK